MAGNRIELIEMQNGHAAASQPHLALHGLSRSFGTVRAVHVVTLAAAEGEFVALLGPSGCGKTTLLRMIAGLDRPDAGQITLGGQDITPLPAWEREIGMVFQSLALFPHLTVGENIAYGLTLRRAPAASVRARVGELLDLVRLPGMAERSVAALSGGQRQRVAIARALALRPRLFLLDEPLSALDAQLRETMQVELRLLQKQLGITTVMVTHDQREAMTMADRIAVFAGGVLQQAGSPMDVYRNPATAFVASFLGTSNLLPVRIDAGRPMVGDVAFVDLPPHDAEGTQAVLSFRPEDVLIDPESDAGLAACVPGRVVFRRDLGAASELHVNWDNRTIVALVAAQASHAPGDVVTIGFRAAGGRVVRP